MAADLSKYPWAIRVETFEEDWKVLPRESWGEGPWLTEPDLIEWRSSEAPYPLIIRRGGTGALCGYVGIPPEHPFHGRSPFPGTNHAGPCDDFRAPTGEPPTCWWFGFDCARGYSPFHEAFVRFTIAVVQQVNPDVQAPRPLATQDEYVDVAACRERVESLAAVMLYWENSLRGVTSRPIEGGMVELVRANGERICTMGDDAWEGFVQLGRTKGIQKTETGNGG